MTSPRLILLDVVGTLAAVRGSVGTQYSQVAADHGVTVAAATLDARLPAAWRAAGPHPIGEAAQHTWWRRLVRHVLADHATTFPAGFDAFFADLWEHFATPAAWHVYPDTRPALDRWLARDLDLGVVSNFDERLPRLLAALDLADAFSHITTPSRAGAAKPSPRIFRHALALHGVPASQAWHIGDRRDDDLEGARAAGITGKLVDRAKGLDLLSLG